MRNAALVGLCVVSVACGSKAQPTGPAPGPSGGSNEASDLHVRPGTPETCRSDRDCHRPGCGPCGSGDVIVEEDHHECVVDPCGRDTIAVCRHEMCVIEHQ